MLLKGILLFLVLGLLFFFAVLGVEYFLWLGGTGRMLLLGAFIGLELFLLFRYIVTPLFYLFKIKKGISNKEASVFIGKHFPDVGDKLYNLLDLTEDTNQSELLLASIEQRSERLNPVPFSRAVDFKEILKYTKYLAIPALLLGAIWLSGNIRSFFGSYNRVVNYNLAYEPPAPFSFIMLSDELNVLDSRPIDILVTTEGDVRPDQVYITVDGKKILLQEQNGIYKYTFAPPLSSTNFFFAANEVASREYRLNALRTPSIQNFRLVLDYPAYTNKKREVLEITGNATFPEGTKVTWQIEGKNTERIHLITKDTSLVFDKEGEGFKLTKRVYSDLNYQLTTSNKNVSAHEKLEYRFKAVKDAHPSIKARQVLDSLNPNISYYVGEASDDYSVKQIDLVCYADTNPEKRQIVNLESPNTNFNQFYYTFPSGLQLDSGTNYSFYFEATDNDGLHNGKTSKSQVFSMILLNEDQLKGRELETQQSLINNMDKSLEKFKEQKETLKEINQAQKENKQSTFNEKNRIKDFLKKQQQQEAMMEKFSKQLKESLNKGEDDKLNKLLKERLERQEIAAKKNEKLLEELNKIADKINKEELAKRLEELAKKQQNSERNLEQLLELTKRYYVTEKAGQLAKELEKLAKKQEREANKKEAKGKVDEQDIMNKEFKKLVNEINELKKDNEALKKPLEMEIDKQKQEDISGDQKEASEELKNEKSETSDAEKKQQSGKKASNKQKSAAQKMKEMSEQLRQSASAGGGGSTITEDAEMLRQILDNLVIFSFKQEVLHDNLEDSDVGSPQFSNTIRKQKELRNLFEHVDDSLFALSLRRAELSEFVNEQITEVYYNTDKALEDIAESRIYQGVSHQKYILTAANSLSDFLANVLDNMQQSMQSGEGEGEGEGFQLPDIIKSQGELKEKMEGMGQSGKGQPKEGEGEGEKGKGEDGGKQGEEGKEGKEGKQGEEGQGKEGKNGVEGSGIEGKGGNGNAGGNGKSQGESGRPSEEELREIYEIYKEQQVIREQLEQQLKDMINANDRRLGQKLIRQIEDFENDLLENGFTQRGRNKINNIQYEMLKLENAAIKQGKKKERESDTNKNNFINPITTKPSLLGDYRNDIEILNRETLPLRQNFKNRVKEYFKSDD